MRETKQNIKAIAIVAGIGVIYVGACYASMKLFGKLVGKEVAKTLVKTVL